MNNWAVCEKAWYAMSFRDLDFDEIPVVVDPGPSGRLFQKWMPIGMPKIPNELLRSTFYLYPSKKDALEGQSFGGTGFIVGVPSVSDPSMSMAYAVTNWHVACRDGCSVIRMTTKDGNPTTFDFGPEDWQFVPGGDDIAVVELPITEDMEFKFASTDMFITRQHIETNHLGVGEDVFMLGRYIDHDRGVRNTPSARFGNISMLPDGPVEVANGAFRPTFLIDMHSRTGHSGSPMFVYRTPGADFTSPSIRLDDRVLMLLGIHWGQFPELWEFEILNGEKAQKESPAEGYVKGLSGMTCVAPAWSIMETLDLPKLKDKRAKIEAHLASQAAARSMQKPMPETAIENPNHKEDFNRLLDVAVKDKKPSD